VESEWLSASVQLAGFRQRLIEAEGEEATARAALAVAMGSPVLAPAIHAQSIPEVRGAEGSVEEALARAETQRAELKTAKAAVDDARIGARIARGSLLPRVDSFASWGASGRGFGDRNRDRSAGITVTLDVLDAGKFARVAGAAAQEDLARGEAAAARDRVRMEVITAWHRARSARERVSVAEKAVEQAMAAARIVRDRYETGLTTITEHLRAQAELAASRFDAIETRRASLTSEAELLRAMGDLHDVTIFE